MKSIIKAPELGLKVDIQVCKFNTTIESITMYLFPRALPSERSASQISCETLVEMVEAKQFTLNVAHYTYQYDSSGHYNSIESSVTQSAIRLNPVTVYHKHVVWTAPHRTLTSQVFCDPELLALFKDC